MSVCFLVVPAVIVGWPTFCAAAAAAAATMGFAVMKKSTMGFAVMKKREKAVRSETCELEIANSKVLTEQVREDDELTLAKGDITVRLYKDPRGKCAIHVSGEGKTRQELRDEGTELVNRIMQQYSYQKVTQELKNRGFSITEEEVTEDRRIRIRLRKFG